MWFGIVFAILVEIVPLKMRSTTVGVFLFVMNNIGGNLPILVDPVGKALGYRESISIFYAGFYGISKSFRVVSSFSIFTIPPPQNKVPSSSPSQSSSWKPKQSRRRPSLRPNSRSYAIEATIIECLPTKIISLRIVCETLRTANSRLFNR